MTSSSGDPATQVLLAEATTRKWFLSRPHLSTADRQQRIGLLIFAWAVLVIAAYYVVHKPFTPVLVESVWPLVVVAATVLAAACLAAPLIPPDAGLSTRARLSLSAGLGLGLLGFIQLGLAAAHIFSPFLSWGLMALACALGFRRLHGWRGAIYSSADRPSLWLAIFCGIMLGCALLKALAPPVAWDALVYHLSGPKLVLAAHGLSYEVDLPYLGFPQWGEMLFLWVMQLGGDRAPAVMHWAFAPLTLMLLPDLLRPIAPRRGWLAAAVLLSTTTAVILAGWPYVEWAMMFAVTAGALAMARWAEVGGKRWLVLAGLMAGLAFGAKYNAAGAILGLVAALVYLRVSDRHPLVQSSGVQTVVHSLAVFSLAALVAALPWLIKDAWLTQNPVYPFFFPGKFWDAARAWWFSRGGTGLPAWRMLIAPWEMTVLGTEGAAGYSATIGPVWLLLLPALVVSWSVWSGLARRRLRMLLAIAVVAYTIWLAQVAWSTLLVQSRLLLGVFPILACVAAAAFDGLSTLNTRRVHIHWLVGAVIGIILALTALETIESLFKDNPVSVLTGERTETDYLQQKLGWYPVAMDRINGLPAGSKVLFLWEPRSYYCRVACVPDALLDYWWHLRRAGLTARQATAQWRAEGISHVLVYELGRAEVQTEGWDPLTPEDWSEFEQLQGQMTAIADFGGVYQLYQLSAGSSQASAQGTVESSHAAQ